MWRRIIVSSYLTRTIPAKTVSLELNLDIQTAIRELKSPIYRAIALSMLHGMTEKEIKSELKVAGGTIQRVKAILRERLKAWRN